MKLNSPVKITLLFLVIMLGAGTVSAVFGLKMGQEALKGVSQPESNPAKKLTDQQEVSEQPQEFKPLSEKVILTKIQAYTQSSNTTAKSSVEKSDKEKQNGERKTTDKAKQASNANLSANFPLAVQDQGVILEVTQVSQQGGSLLLAVNLRNEGAKEVQFLYSFLEVKDDSDRSLSAITEGLPEKLPSNGETLRGKIKIPIGVVGEAQKLSISLTDYPEQTLKLNLADIPVTQSAAQKSDF